MLPGAVEDVNAGDGVKRDGDVEVEMAGLGVIDAEAVEQDERLLEGSAADGEVSLNAIASACLQVEGRVLAEQVDDAVADEWLVAGRKDVDGAVTFGERQRFESRRNGDAFGDGCGFVWGLGWVG